MISKADHIAARGTAGAAEKSEALLRRTADTGDAEAIFALGVSYLLGCGVRTNFREALKLLDRAVHAGVKDALYFRALAEEQAQREADDCFRRGEAAVEALLEEKRREMFPRPRIVGSTE